MREHLRRYRNQLEELSLRNNIFSLRHVVAGEEEDGFLGGFLCIDRINLPDHPITLGPPERVGRAQVWRLDLSVQIGSFRFDGMILPYVRQDGVRHDPEVSPLILEDSVRKKGVVLNLAHQGTMFEFVDGVRLFFMIQVVLFLVLLDGGLLLWCEKVHGVLRKGG